MRKGKAMNRWHDVAVGLNEIKGQDMYVFYLRKKGKRCHKIIMFSSKAKKLKEYLEGKEES